MIERYDHGHSLRDSSGSEEQINAGRAAAYAGCDSPECRAVRDAIPDLLVGNPGTVERLGAKAVFAPGTRILVMWVVKGGGVWHAIARRSASIENDHESNDYIDAITQLHVDHPVQRWFVGPANRMTRSQAFVGRLERALVRNGTTVMSDAGAIDVPSTAWNALIMINDITVTETVKGLHGRLIEHVATGLWPKGEVPPGYWRNPQTDLLEVDEGPRTAEMVAAIIDSPHWQGTARQILDRLGQDYGVPASATFRGKVLAEDPRRDPASITIDQVPSADAALRVLWSKLEWYRDGGREHRTSVPDVMRTGIPVTEDGRRVFRGHELENHDGNLEVSGWSPMPLPPGGWATPEVFERSIAARDARRASHRLTLGRPVDVTSDRKPLSGIGKWRVDDADGGWEYRLGANRATTYEIHRRRPSSAGWANERGELIASVSAVELHRCVAGMILAGCEQGLPLTSVVSTPQLAANPSTEDLERVRLEEQLTRARLAVERAEDSELEAIDEAEAQRYRAAKRRRMAEIDELTEQVAALKTPAPPDADSDRVDVLTLAALVAELEQDQIRHAAVTGDALREAIADLRVTPTSSLLCQVEMRLRLRTPGGRHRDRDAPREGQQPSSRGQDREADGLGRSQ